MSPAKLIPQTRKVNTYYIHTGSLSIATMTGPCLGVCTPIDLTPSDSVITLESKERQYATIYPIERHAWNLGKIVQNFKKSSK